MCGCETEELISVKSISTNERGIAIDGYDVVAYFNGKIQKGAPQYSFDWNGATFWFANSAHRDVFATNPKEFSPQYGGHCAFGMGFGKVAPGDPNAFMVKNEKLYLNASPMVLQFWRWFGNIEKSDSQWKSIKTKDNF